MLVPLVCSDSPLPEPCIAHRRCQLPTTPGSPLPAQLGCARVGVEACPLEQVSLSHPPGCAVPAQRDRDRPTSEANNQCAFSASAGAPGALCQRRSGRLLTCAQSPCCAKARSWLLVCAISNSSAALTTSRLNRHSRVHIGILICDPTLLQDQPLRLRGICKAAAPEVSQDPTLAAFVAAAPIPEEVGCCLQAHPVRGCRSMSRHIRLCLHPNTGLQRLC